MRAVVCQEGALEVRDVPAPRPARGQLVLDVLACGICGSDLHARHHADAAADAAQAAGYDDLMRPGDAVVLGHEFCGEVEGGGRRWRGPVVAMPMVRAAGGVHLTGLTTHAPGAYAEQVLVQESLTFAVPNGLAPDAAALTEPTAVALHAVDRGQVARGRPAIVVGCGPVGLGVVGVLKARGVRTVVASDPSPARRALARALGADVVVDPGEESPFDAAVGAGARFLDAQQLFGLAVGSMEKLRAVPLLPWQHVFRLAEAAGAGPQGPVVFECVGVPGILDTLITSAPLATRVVVVGVCMADDVIKPSIAINKEVDLRFVLGYTPAEFRAALHLLAEGEIDANVLVSGRVGLAGVEEAFAALADPETHAKVLVDPSAPGQLVRT
ncbi:zinc-binding dehydrogenase [Nocardioides litoris]|uniref:zinc-binding dehydrogenase n=1 Tax=Nocardioides litoris TaxID=1926648 RepID=UPI001121DF8D|nr:zinc-binding dehydrogenase [Nocardioides litoris]